MENTSTETLEVKYFLLEKDNTRTMKLFLEVELAKQFFFKIITIPSQFIKNVYRIGIIKNSHLVTAFCYMILTIFLGKI